MSTYEQVETATMRQLREACDRVAEQVTTVGDPCGCDDEWPCEAHCVVLAQYEGASLRTADELLRVVLDELTALACQSQDPEQHDAHMMGPADDDCATVVYGDRPDDDGIVYWSFCGMVTLEGGWVEDRDLADFACDLARSLESELPEQYRAAHDDGFTLVRITGGPLHPEYEDASEWADTCLDAWVEAEVRPGRIDTGNVWLLVTCGGPDIRVEIASDTSARIHGAWGSDRVTRHVAPSGALYAWAESFIETASMAHAQWGER